MTTLVEMMAPTCQSGDAFSRNGYDGMICSQNRTPVTKKLACISQMWTSWFSSAASKRAGTCQSTMTALNETSAVQGLTTNRPTARSGARTRPEQHRTGRGAGAAPTGRPWRSGQPRRAGHDEDRGEEGDQDVLDHVDEEVVVRPVVDGRRDGEQEHAEPGVEEERPQPPAPASARGPSAAAGWPGPTRGAPR